MAQEENKMYIDLELEQGLREVASLIQRKVIEPSQKQRVTEVNSEESRLNTALMNCPPEWGANIQRVIFSETEIQRKVRELALQISKDYRGKDLLCVGILNGAVCFMTDLLKHLLVPYKIDFLALSSYSGTASTGTVKVKKDLSHDPSGKHILIIEDLIDTGNTLKWLKQYLLTKKCASVRLCTLLDKKEGRVGEDVAVDYVGYDCPNEFVVGYGMDFNEDYRCLPFVGVLKPEAYSK